MRLWPRFAVVLAVIALAAAACASGTKGTSGSTPTGSASARTPVTLSGAVTNKGTADLSAKGSSASIEVEQDNDNGEFYFKPTFIEAAPGATISVELKNEGSVPHTFTIDSLKIDKELQPDKTADVSVKLPSSGVIVFYCRFHQASGMQGAFFFQPGGTASPGSSGSGY
jgi:plastocyanin